jgi:hypothetical protein
LSGLIIALVRALRRKHKEMRKEEEKWNEK